MRCKTKRPIQNAHRETTESGRPAARGACPSAVQICLPSWQQTTMRWTARKGVPVKSDIDRLMAERNLDWIVIEGPDGFAGANPDYAYFTNGQHLTGTVLKQRGAPAMIVYRAMERQQAADTGLVMVPRERWNMREIRQQFPDNFYIRGRAAAADVHRSGHSRASWAVWHSQSRAALRGHDRLGPAAAGDRVRGRVRKRPALDRATDQRCQRRSIACARLAARPARWCRRWSTDQRRACRWRHAGGRKRPADHDRRHSAADQPRERRAGARDARRHDLRAGPRRGHAARTGR